MERDLPSVSIDARQHAAAGTICGYDLTRNANWGRDSLTLTNKRVVPESSAARFAKRLVSDGEHLVRIFRIYRAGRES